MDFFSMFRRPRKSRKPGKSSAASGSHKTSRPGLEALEDRMLLSASVISGYVYHDANHNGLFDAGETPIANSPLDLRNASGQVIASTTSAANGYYEFTNDNSINTNPVTLEQTVTIPSTLAGFSISKAVNQFDPSLGQLLEVEIIHNGSITSDVRAENSSTLVGATITGTVAGTMTLSGPGFSLDSTISANAGTFQASAYDGLIDFAGTSGKDFGPYTAIAQTKSITLSGNQINAFIGTGQLNFNELVNVNSTATGGGNLMANITSSASATFTVRYKYKPANTLQPGTYTVVQKEQPPLPNGPGRYLDGLESRNGSVLPNTIGTDQISVTLNANGQAPNNNFGEQVPATLAGSVYFDQNNNGIMDPSEQGISGATVTLTGTDDAGQPVTRTATTSATGAYKFDNLRPGTYTINEQQPANYLDGKESLGSLGGTVTNDQFGNIGVSDSANGINYNFGEVKTSSLAGFVYNDSDNDGIKDSGEAGISGVSVSLSGTDDLGNSVTRTVTTGADGSYLFDNLRAGTYAIKETQPAGYLDGKDTIGTPGGNTANDQFSNIALPFNTAGVNNNFGEIQSAGLSGYVYNDVDNDGFKDSGEQGIAGASVSLSGTDDLGNSVTRTTTTGADGSYKFDNLRAGTYAINETQPSGYLDGKDTIGTPGGNTANDQFTNIVLPVNGSGVNNNFGELKASSLAGFVYNDTDNDGFKDSSEAGIAGASVSLSGTDDLGNSVTRTTTTGADGSYKFDNLRAGTYAINETQPSGYLDGKDTIGTPGGNTANDQFTNVVLPFNTAGVNNNFGELKAASLAGYVYSDLDNDGIMESGEQGIPGARVTLSGIDDLGNSVSRSLNTAGDGSYKFDNLRPGNYSLQESQPANYLDGKDTAGTPGGQVSNDLISGINLTAGTAGMRNNFGELLPASLAGHVYNDLDNDGIMDSGEPGIAGARVTLSGTDDLGSSVSRTLTTGADGSYKFDNLRPGTYTLTEQQPASYQDGQEHLGSLGGVMSNDRFSSVGVDAGEQGTDYDFGEINPTGVSGVVWHDNDNDGVIDFGEQGIGGVVLKLTGQTNTGASVTRQTTTAADGSYNFDNLMAGTYNIQEMQPGNWMDGKDSRGTAGGTMTNDNFSGVTLTEGAPATNYNFGELKPGSIAGHVWQDDDNDGHMDNGEQGIGGVGVTLTGTDDQGQAVTRNASTAADGSYSFDNLRPGTYSVQETQPAGWTDGLDSLGSMGGTMTNDRFSNLVLHDSQNGTDYDFGERRVTDVGITKKVVPTKALPGANLTYTLVVTNYGPSDAQNVRVVDNLPSAVTFVTATATGWTLTLENGNVVFTRNSLAVGASSTITITAVAPMKEGVYNNVAVVSTTTEDTNPDNNTDRAQVTVQKPPTESEKPPVVGCVLTVNSLNDAWAQMLRRSMGL